MKKTPNLNLPVYDTPSVDTFKVEDWNKANETLDYVFGEIKSQGNISGIDVTARQGVVENKEKLTYKANTVDLESTNNRVSTTNTRIDNLIIPSGNANVEVTDSHTSLIKNKTFGTLGNRLEEQEDDSYKLAVQNKDIILKKVDGTNLFDVSKATDVTLLMSNGNTSSSGASGWRTTDFIPVDNSKKITLNRFRFLCEYDIHKRFITGTFINNTDSSMKTIVLNAKTNFVRFSIDMFPPSGLVPVMQYGEVITVTPVYKTPILKDSNGGKLAIDEVINNKYETKPNGKNLFNSNTVYENTTLDPRTATLGLLIQSSNWSTSEFIEVSSETNVSVNKVRFICEYDEFKNAIYGTHRDIQSLDTTFKTNSKTKYIRITVSSFAITSTQVELGTACTPYEPVSYGLYVDNKEVLNLSEVGGMDVSSTSFYISSITKNIFSNTNVLVDKVLNNLNGSITNATSWSTSDFINVDGGKVLSINKLRYLAEYDKYKNFIKITDGTVSTLDTTVTLDLNTKYIRFSSNSSRMNIIQVEYNSSCTSFVPYESGLFLSGTKIMDLPYEKDGETFNVRASSKNIFDKNSVVLDKVINTNGYLYDSANWSTSDYIPVISLATVSINAPRVLAEYDKDKKFVKYFDNLTTQLPLTYTLQESTKYLRVSFLTSRKDFQVEYGNSCTSYSEYTEGFYLYDKKLFDVPFTMSNVSVGTSEKKVTLSEYKMMVDREKYQLYEAIDPYSKVVALRKNIAVKLYSTGTPKIAISTTGINGEYSYEVLFNSTNFPNLIDGSGIEYVMLLPYTRNETTGRDGVQTRLVVCTNKGQVYHNYPNRTTTSDGAEQTGDIIKFDESVLWDLPTRKYPSTNPNATGVERYMPCLPSICYEYHPPISQDNGYGNGGFGKEAINHNEPCPRFYQPNRTWQSTSFSPMGGYEPDDKISLVGTYKSNTAESVRICVFATDDGGRQWYVKHELGDNNSAPITNSYNTTTLSNNYVANAYCLSGRTTVIPNAEVKEPSTLFNWGTDVVITNISKAEKCVITTATPHGLSNNQVFAIKQNNNGVSSGYEWLLNNSVSDVSGGNGVLFKAKVLSTTTIELYEMVMNPHNNIPARHIHHINRVKDGWIIGTGETYPQGFIYYMQMKESDAFARKYARDNFLIVRLTSTPNAVQRLIGATMLDDKDTTMIVAVDNETTPRANVIMPNGRTETFSRGSTGIFRGRLQDIDDMGAFECIYDSMQVAYFFKDIKGIYVYFGQQGEFAISFDKGKSWSVEDVYKKGEHFFGESEKIIAVDTFIIAVK